MKEYIVTLACGHIILASEGSVKHYRFNPDVQVLCDTCRRKADFYRYISKIDEVTN